MLDVAIKHKEDLSQKFQDIWFSEKYKYWNNGNYYEDKKIDETTWSNHQFVSLNPEGEVIGYIGYSIDRGNDCVYGLSIINFSEDIATFGLDAGKAITDIFEKYHFRKLCFAVVVGNPIEETYDRLTAKHGGRIVGIQKQHTRLIDNLLYDEKIYEILADEYRSNRNSIKTKEAPR